MPEVSGLASALASAIDEIKSLRSRNELLSAKVEMIDLFACVLHTQAAHRGGGAMHPDPLWLLQRELENLTAEKSPGGEPSAEELGSEVRRRGLQGKGMSGL